MISLRSSLLSALAALSVYAATYQPAAAAVASTYTVQGNVYRVVEFAGADSEKIRLNTVVKGPAANNPYAARVVPIKASKFQSWFKPKFGSLVKANAWWFAYMGLISAAGWVYDEASGRVLANDPNSAVGFFWMGENYDHYGFLVTGETPLKACDTLGSKVFEWSPSFESYSPTISKSGERYQCRVRVTKDDGMFQDFDTMLGKIPCGVFNSTYPRPETLSTCNGALPAGSPVSDADIMSSIIAEMAADPARAATAFTDPATGKGYADLFEPVPYIPGLSAADEALVNCYISGQLQMVNSQTACYVATQAEYDRIKQQTEALAAGKTPEATAEALNNDLKQPITQTQYEESNKKYSDAVADVTAYVSAQNESDYSDIDDHFSDLDGIITDLPNTSLPSPADISVPQYVDCQQLHLSDGNGHDLDFPNAAQCAKIETFKQGFGYFLALSVVFLLGMQLLTRPHG